MQGYTNLTNTNTVEVADVCRFCLHRNVCRFTNDALKAEEKLNAYLLTNGFGIQHPIKFELKCDHKQSSFDITYTSSSINTAGPSDATKPFITDTGNQTNNQFIEKSE